MYCVTIILRLSILKKISLLSNTASIKVPGENDHEKQSRCEKKG